MYKMEDLVTVSQTIRNLSDALAVADSLNNAGASGEKISRKTKGIILELLDFEESIASSLKKKGAQKDPPASADQD